MPTQIRVTASVGVKPALDSLAPLFKRDTGRSLRITYGTAVPLKREIEAGAKFDLAILPSPMIEELVKAGRVAADTSAFFAKSEIGVAVREGAPKPDIASTDALRRTLLNARAIAYSKEGQAGYVMEKLMHELGIAADMSPKTILETRSGCTACNVAEGKADLAFTIASEILPIKGAEFAGPLPPNLRHYVFFSAGVGPAARNPADARAFIDFLRSPEVGPILMANGMERV